MSAAGATSGLVLEDVDLGRVTGLEGLTQSPLKLLVVEGLRVAHQPRLHWAGPFVSVPADAIRLRSNSATPTAGDAMAAVRNSAPGTGSFRCSSPLGSKGLNGQAPPPRRRGVPLSPEENI
jgi:hypothetical protein